MSIVKKTETLVGVVPPRERDVIYIHGRNLGVTVRVVVRHVGRATVESGYVVSHTFEGVDVDVEDMYYIIPDGEYVAFVDHNDTLWIPGEPAWVMTTFGETDDPNAPRDPDDPPREDDDHQPDLHEELYEGEAERREETESPPKDSSEPSTEWFHRGDDLDFEDTEVTETSETTETDTETTSEDSEER